MVQFYKEGVVKLKCAATGTPTPTIEWGIIKESNLEFNSLSKPRINSLKIKLSVQYEDTGRYSCKVVNKFQVLYSPPFALLVYSKYFNLNEVKMLSSGMQRFGQGETRIPLPLLIFLLNIFVSFLY